MYASQGTSRAEMDDLYRCRDVDGLYGDVGLLICAGLCTVGINKTFPYRISRTLICSLFYASGFAYNKYIRNRISIGVKNILAPLFFVGFVHIASHTSFYLGGNQFSNKLAFIMGSYMAILFFVWLSNKIATIKTKGIDILIYLGMNSMDIVIWQFLAFRLAIIPQIYIYGVGSKALTAFPVYDASGLWWLVYVIAGLFGSLAWRYVLNHNYLTSLLKRIHVIR